MPTACNDKEISGQIDGSIVTIEACEQLMTSDFTATEDAALVLAAGQGITLGSGTTTQACQDMVSTECNLVCE